MTWQKPAYWDEIAAYGKMQKNFSDTEKRIAARLPWSIHELHSRACLTTSVSLIVRRTPAIYELEFDRADRTRNKTIKVHSIVPSGGSGP